MPAKCRTAIFICLLTLWSVVVIFAFGLLLAAYLLAQRKNQIEKMARIIMNIYGRGCMLLASPWVKVQRECLHLLKGPCIVAANHLSMLDLTCLPFLPDKNLCLIIKSWPATTPFMGLFVRKAGYINASELTFTEIARRVQEEVGKKSILVIFPEGSRSPDGRLQRLRPGAFKLAIANGLPIYPLRYTGTNQAFPKGKMLLNPATITMRLYDKILPPANNASDSRAHKRLGRQVREYLRKAA